MRPGSPHPPADGRNHELEREHRKEVAEHKETKEALIAVRVTAFVLLALLIASVLLWWFVLR